MALVWIHIGMMKAGSTWLYTWMNAHPELAAPFETKDVRRGKNPFYWNRDDPIGRPPRKTNRPKMTPEVYRECIESAPKVFDLTDSYSYMPGEAIAALQAEHPDVLVTCTVRDPVEAMWSHLNSRKLTIEDAEQGRAPRQIANAQIHRNIERWRASGFDPRVIMFARIVVDPLGVLRDIGGRLGVDTTWWDRHANEAHEPILVSKPRPNPTIDDRMRMRALIETPNSARAP